MLTPRSTDHNFPDLEDESDWWTAASLPPHSLSLQLCGPAALWAAANRSAVESGAGNAGLRRATGHSLGLLAFPALHTSACSPEDMALGRHILVAPSFSALSKAGKKAQVAACCFLLGTSLECCRMGSRELLESKPRAVTSTGCIRCWSN